MSISSRTPEGLPNDCPICGNSFRLEPSLPSGDAPCPNCGHLLWWFQKRFRREDQRLTVDTRFLEDLQADSIDVIELVMECEDEFEISISDKDYERIKTVGDAIRLVESRRTNRN